MKFKEEYLSVIEVLEDLHPYPRVLQKTNDIVRDVNLDMKKLVSFISTDSNLTANIIRVSNSAYYGFDLECRNLAESINRIGIEEVKRIIKLFIAKDVKSSKLDLYGMSSEEYWCRSASAGILMENLTQFSRKDPIDAYTIGILHLIGKVLLNEIFKQKKLKAWNGTSDVLKFEVQKFGCNYAYAGAMLLKRWNYPHDACRALLRQLDAPSALEIVTPYHNSLNFSLQLLKVTGLDFEDLENLDDVKHLFLDKYNVSHAALKHCLLDCQKTYRELRRELFGEEEVV